MVMTESEIVRNYREAKYKKSQIQILSELNACDRKDIINILRNHGIPFPGNPNFGSNFGKNKDKKEGNKVEAKENKEVTESKGTKADTIKETTAVDKTNTTKTTASKTISNNIVIADVVRIQLEEDLIKISAEINTLIDKKIAIENFLNAVWNREC